MIKTAIPALQTSLAKNLLLGVVYFASAKLGLLLAVSHPNVTAVWPPSGIALAAVLLCGYRVLPGVAFGAFLTQATTAGPLLAIAGIVAGSALEVCVAISLLYGLFGFQPDLARLRDILALFGAALASAAVAATVGALTLWMSGSLAWPDYPWAWATWWAGDALGIVIVTPLILVWTRGERPNLSPPWLGERLLLLCALMMINLVVFHGAFIRAESNYPLTYLSLSAMSWVALRLSRRVAVAAAFGVSVLAVWGTTHGLGPFADEVPATRLLLLATFLGVMAFMTLTLSVIKLERQRAQEALRACEEFKASMIDASRDCFQVLDLKGRLLSVNAGGMAAPELDELKPFANTSWIDSWQADDRTAAHAAVTAASGGNMGRFTGYLPTPVTHKPMWWDVVVSPIVDAQGRVEKLLVTSRDATEHKQAERAIRQSEAQKRAFLESALECIIGIDSEGRIVEFNPAAEKTFGYPREQIIGEPMSDYIIPPRLRERHARGLKHYLATGCSSMLSKSMELTAMRADSSEFPVEITVESTALNGHPPMFTAFLRDISERTTTEAALRRGEQRHRALVTATTSIVWTAAADGAIVDDIPAWEAFTGQTPAEYKGWGWLNAVHPEDRENTVRIWRRALEIKQADETENRLRHRDGRFRHMLMRGVPVFGSDGCVYEWMGTCSDISERKQAEQDLVHMANHDALTGLPNRTLFMDRLGQALSRALRYKEEVAVLFVDLDGFKHVNDTLGHDVGDLLLKAIAKRLIDCMRSSDTVARFGGDEFVMMPTGFAQTHDVNRIADEILKTLSMPVQVNGRELFITASIGVSVYPRDGNDPHTLLKSADTAMYLAKHGGNRYRHFSTSLGAKTSRRLTLEQDLRRALTREEFVLHYQPEVDLASGKIDTVEALLRWRRPDRDGFVPPLEFIPLAEECGLIIPIGEWVLSAACAQSRAWSIRGLPPVRVAVNVSARQFQQQHAQKVINRVLREAGVEHSSLELELTESILQAKEAERMVIALARSGVNIAIDDFGTGYSSLSYLKRFPAHKLKIDRSFIHQIPSHQDNVAISTAIIAMAHSLNLKVTAEGVETTEQLDFLRELGCDGVQGYLLGRPMPAEAVTSLLTQEVSVAHQPRDGAQRTI